MGGQPEPACGSASIAAARGKGMSPWIWFVQMLPALLALYLYLMTGDVMKKRPALAGVFLVAYAVISAAVVIKLFGF